MLMSDKSEAPGKTVRSFSGQREKKADCASKLPWPNWPSAWVAFSHIANPACQPHRGISVTPHVDYMSFMVLLLTANLLPGPSCPEKAKLIFALLLSLFFS